MEEEFYNTLRQHIAQKVTLCDEDWKKMKDHFKPKFIKKKKDLFYADEVSKHIAFIVKGCMRSYSIDLKGKEHTAQLAFENYWIGDLWSFLAQEPSIYTVEAIEDSVILKISQAKLQQLYSEVPVMERFFRLLVERAYVATMQRLNGTIKDTAEIRYKKLMENKPEIIQRIPLTYIASFLGITPESLSRIRRQL